MVLTSVLALVSAASFALGSHVAVELEQSFYFDWNLPSQTVPVPTTAQCDVIEISWSRGNAQGPNPTAPYYLQIYTSTFIVPFVVAAGSGVQFNWTVPFIPTTQYQICMFDSNGNTGGCQAIYTVYPAINSSVQNPPTCANVTFPATPLQVEGTVVGGPLSQYGWINQCTDLSLTPKSGTPPYTMTIAPSLRPPFNITSSTQSTITWAVALSYGSPFFVSLVDSTGLVWSNGPLHSGANSDTSCLSLSKNKLSPSVAVGSGVGGFIVGSLLGISAAYFFIRRKYSRVGRRSSTSSSLDPIPFTTGGTASYDPISSSTRPLTGPNHMGQYVVEPFALSNNIPLRSPPSPSHATPSSNDSQTDPSSAAAQRSHVYVVHHDGGRAPVTVYTDGADVVELPPTYARQEDGTLQPTRRAANSLPRKAQNSSAARGSP